MRWPNRIMLSIAIAVTVLMLLAFVGYLSGRWNDEEKTGLIEYFLAGASSQPIPEELCVADEESKERIRGMVLESLDDALKEQFKHLFEVWMRDERGQPGRAKVGVIGAIRAHQSARKNTIEWDPKFCS